MKRFLTFISLLFFLFGCATEVVETHPSGLDIVEIHPNKLTGIAKQNLLHLTQVYDLRPFLFTKMIQIESGARNRSHPIMRINTKHAEEPLLLLSTFLHEEIHWWLKANPKNLTLALRDVKKAYPKAKAHLHLELIACYLEFRAVTYYLGAKEGTFVLQRIQKKDRLFPWAYKEVLRKNPRVAKIVKRHGLTPKVLEPDKKPVALGRKKA